MIEVLKQMVDALQTYSDKHRKTYLLENAWDEEITKGDAAIQAGKQAIKELESQEPVAWVAEDVCEGQYIDGRPRKIWWECEKSVGTAFYAHLPQRTEQEPWCMKMNGCTAKCEDCPDEPPPTPQRTWAGLAKEDRLCAKYMQDAPDGIEAVIDYIEAKLKEKNT